MWNSLVPRSASLLRPKVDSPRYASFPPFVFDYRLPKVVYSPSHKSIDYEEISPLYVGMPVGGRDKYFMPSLVDKVVSFNKADESTVFKKTGFGLYRQEPANCRFPVVYTDASVRAPMEYIKIRGPGDCAVGFYATDGWRKIFACGYIGIHGVLFGEAAIIYAWMQVCFQLKWFETFVLKTDCAALALLIDGSIPVGKVGDPDAIAVVKYIYDDYPYTGWGLEVINRYYNCIPDKLAEYAQDHMKGEEGVIRV